MKKSELQQIIREEIGKVLTEEDTVGPANIDFTGTLLPQLHDIYDMIYDFEEQLDTASNEAFNATGLAMFEDMKAQGSRYTKAIIQQLENLGNYLERIERRVEKLNR